MHCDTQCSSSGSLVFAHLGSISISRLVDTFINIYYFSIFQYHNNNTTNINNINVHLTVIVSLRVPPLLADVLSNLDVILLLFVNLLSGYLLPD